MLIPGITASPLLISPGSSGPSISEIFNTSLWTGTGADRTITTGIDSGEGSLVWSKGRTSSGFDDHALNDTARGAGNWLRTNGTNAEAGNPGNMFLSFTSSGYTLGFSGRINSAGINYVGWQFRRAPKFFDIVQYTGDGVAGRQIAHNLGIKPGMIIVKRTDTAADWQIYHQAQGAAKYGVLNSTDAFATASNRWNNTEPASGVFTVGNDATVNASGGTYIAYPIAHDPSPNGVIQCGSYVGNGSATGTVITLGWRPQYLMIKNATATGDWQIIDAQRGFTATDDAILLANTSGAETSSNLANPNSTGFQIASSVSNVNTSGQTYIYMAIREA